LENTGMDERWNSGVMDSKNNKLCGSKKTYAKIFD
jgi:hypothetical protein